MTLRTRDTRLREMSVFEPSRRCDGPVSRVIIDYIEVEKWVGKGEREVGNVRGSIECSSSLLTGFGPMDNTRG